MELEKILVRVQTLMKKEDRKDAEFRYVIASTEFGDLGKYITHDPELNPGARPHGSVEDEKLAYGQTLVMLMGLMYLRKVEFGSALELGLRNWEDADWRKREAAKKDEVVGITGCHGTVSGKAYVVSPKHPLKDVEPWSILVTEYAKPDIANYMDKIVGFVTDHGGFTCHAANVAREKYIPCIVGTGNATKLIKHGQAITLDASERTGRVEIDK